MAGGYVQINGMDRQVARIKRLEGAVQKPGPHLKLAVPFFVGCVKKNFDAGGRPAKWKKKADGSASHLMKTGRMRSSIHGKVVGKKIRVGTGVKQAAIHHFGGTISLPEIRPVNAKALRFKVGGTVVFAKKVRPHDVTIPARPFLVFTKDDIAHGLKIIADSMEREVNRE